MEEQRESGAVALCAACNEPLPATARFCTFCGAPTPRFVPPPTGPTPAERRARHRRWRRTIGALAFVVVAVGVLAVAYSSFSSSDRSASNVSARQPLFATTTPPIPPAGPFKVTEGLNVRSGPGMSYPGIATIDLGKEVMVVCVIDGEAVNGTTGPNAKWLRVTAPGVSGYVTSLYVATGAAIGNPAVIPVCREI